MKNKISVVIPTYNRSGLVARAVESALAAVSPGDEILVIDDGSTDDTAQVLRPFHDRIRYVRTPNAGAGAARNRGIEMAAHPLVAFLDSDDEWAPDKLYLQRAVMDVFPEAVFCFSDLLSRHLDDRSFTNVLALWRNDPAVGCADARSSVAEILGPGLPFSSIAALPGERSDFKVHTGNIYASLMNVYCVWTCSIVVRKPSAGTAFRFPEDTNIFEEWECFARLARQGVAAYLDCELAVQNVHRAERLTDAGDVRKAGARIELLHRVWGADESFLQSHSARYRSILKAQHMRRARYLIREGRMAQARDDLKVAGGSWIYRLLTSLPAPLVGAALGARRRILGR